MRGSGLEDGSWKRQKSGEASWRSSTDPKREITAVGTLPEIGAGEAIEAVGSFVLHPTYGEQFRIRKAEIRAPKTMEEIERYLGSGIIKGVRAHLAAEIVKTFKEHTFDVIEQDPHRLLSIKGIGLERALGISRQVIEKKAERGAILFLVSYGISVPLAMKIYSEYDSDVYRVIEKNPYRLAEEVQGIGFRTADAIARRAGIEADSPYRIACGILYVLEMAGGEGHVYLPEEVLIRRAARLLGFSLPGEGGMDDGPDDFDGGEMSEVPIDPLDPFGDGFSEEESGESLILDGIRNLQIDRKIIVRAEKEERRIYKSRAYFTELSAARMLMNLNHVEMRTEGDLDILPEAEGLDLDEKQILAVQKALQCGVLVLTGGPGTGKTTTINLMIQAFEARGLEIALAAPTGRAAKRMTEATGCEARTIHRLLEVAGDPDEGKLFFSRNEKKQLEEGALIIDEMSMVDIYLFHSLLKAIPEGCHLVMVGDASQLPSVGPGSVLRDLIASETLPVVTLDRIFRQAQESDIVMNAHKINAGQHLNLDNHSKDFFFLKRQNAGDVIGTCIRLVRDSLPGYVHTESSMIQVMTPMKKGLLGTIRLNQILQNYLNPPSRSKREWKRGEVIFREGDRVMQIKNNYQKAWVVHGLHDAVVEDGQGVYNGDMGVIRSISDLTHQCVVEFDEKRMVSYGMQELEELEPAYAVTIHKAQGSEYPAVVIPMLRGPRMLMNRNLLYTAVTRAQKCVAMVGDLRVLNEMIDNENEARRYSSLSLRLRELAVSGKRTEPEDAEYLFSGIKLEGEELDLDFS